MVVIFKRYGLFFNMLFLLVGRMGEGRQGGDN